MKKILLNTSFSKIYVVGVILISILMFGGYFSYAMFTVTKEKENAISIVTGNLTYKLEVDGIEGNTLIVPSNTVKDFTITLSNPNNRTARLNFYYVGSLASNTKVGYIAEEGTNTFPDEKGINLEKEGTTIVEDAIGLLNIYEYQTSYRGTDYRNGYLNNGLSWWTLTSYNSTMTRYIYYSGNATQNYPYYAIGIRPSMNLNFSIKIVSGNGTEEEPYRLEGDNDTNLEGTLLNTRYSGEYVNFGTGKNNLYRIVNHETEGLTKITSAEPLKENETFKSMSFGDTVYYSNTNTIGSFLNGEYLSSEEYLTEEQVNMIENSTVWYLGVVGNGTSYKLAKYTDTGMSGYATSTDAKIGLLRIGEMMSGQFERYAIKNSITSTGLTTPYWILTPYNTSLVYYVSNYGTTTTLSLSSNPSIKPSFNLKQNIIITGGDGTKNNPFTIEFAN